MLDSAPLTSKHFCHVALNIHSAPLFIDILWVALWKWSVLTKNSTLPRLARLDFEPVAPESNTVTIKLLAQRMLLHRVYDWLLLGYDFVRTSTRNQSDISVVLRHQYAEFSIYSFNLNTSLAGNGKEC